MRAYLLICALALTPGAWAAKTLDVYFVDVEGGQATLIVTPAGDSLLVDTGWRGFDGRDANRIAAAAKAAKLKQIDYVLITHYHRDHVGGAPQLADKIHIANFVDHGPNQENSRATNEDYADYEKLMARARRITVKPGDDIPLKGATVQVLTSAGEHIQTAGQSNPLCASAAKRPEDASENARSLGFLLTFGSFRLLDLGDLTWNKELELMCPNNPIGAVDLFVVSHHGSDQSNSPALAQGIGARVAVMNNGARKGGDAEAWTTVHNSPGLEDLWQLHYAIAGGADHNVRDTFIANVDEFCEGKYLKLSAAQDGSFTLLNSRNKFEKGYSARTR
jgi:competence protein ComEC